MEQNSPQRQSTIHGKDRISELPDDIIYQILDNLPTKDAVATTILSKEWKGQWTNCYNLDFSDSYYLSFNTSHATESCFVTVKDVIALNKSPRIKKFRLQGQTMDNFAVNACLDSVLRRNVEEIELDVSRYQAEPVVLPQSLFTCQTLVFLDISLDFWTDLPPLVHLPSLKIFHANLFNPSDAVTTKLFCGLPVLEDLSITLWAMPDEEMTLNIFGASLKRLKLNFEEVYNYKIVVRAPSLKELDIFEDKIVNYVFEELPLDVKAMLKFTMCATKLGDDYTARAIQLMNAISGVKSLALSSCILRTQDFGNVAVFPNLTCLEVDVTSCCGFTYLPFLIDRLPNLVVLVLKMVQANLANVPQRLLPQLLLLYLKRIEVKGFNGQEDELKLIGSLLKVAQVLDEVVIYTRSLALKEQKNLCQKLSSFPRCSKNCQFKILED